MKRAGALAALVMALGCGGGTSEPVPLFCTPTPGTDVYLQEMASGFSRPLLVTAPPRDPRLFVVEQAGRIRILLEDGTSPAQPFLDIRSVVKDLGNEQGLLGLAFHPGYADNGRFFVNYTATDPNDHTVVAEYRVSADDPLRADPGSERRLFTLEQRAANHNGGMLAFGPDGYLYISTGDEGRGDDYYGNGQDRSTLHGAILRIDVDTGEPYGIPASNPFVGQDGADEIWAYGLRNPWRFSFDRRTGDMYIADVGQREWEEINVQPASSAGGENYGWNVYEGTSCFSSPCDSAAGYVAPVHEYDHGGGRCSVTGGYVYRGQCLPDLRGLYFFADFCRGVWSFRYADGAVTELTEWTDTFDPDGNFHEKFTSWGEDSFGELYAISRDGIIYRVTAR